MIPHIGPILLTIIIGFLPLLLHAQDEKKPFFIGLNPGLTIEPFYDKGEMDIHILPVVYQISILSRVDLRLTGILNLGIRNAGSGISHWGIETAFPIFIRKKKSGKECSKGFFIAPVVSTTRNSMENHYNTGLYVEPGYLLSFDKKFAMSFSLQTGSTYFAYDKGQSKWRNHFGIKVILGRWI